MKTALGGAVEPAPLTDPVDSRPMAREFAFPGTRPRYAPDRVVDIQHIGLVLDVDPAKRTVSGTATLRGMVIAPATRVIELDAVELTIDKVTSGGKPVPYRHDGRQLR